MTSRLVKTRPTGLLSRTRGIVSSKSSGRRVEAHSYEPASALAPLVERFWVGKWDLPEDRPHVTQLLGDPSVHLVFEDGPAGPQARIVGVWTRLWERKLERQGRVRAVKFHPGMAGALLPTPVQKWTDRKESLSAEFPDSAQALCRAVLEPEKDEQGLEALARFVFQRARLSPEAQLAREMVTYVREERGVVRVEQLCDHFDSGVRSTQRLFRDHVGAAPKWLIRRNRLQEVVSRLDSGELTSLVALALELGYADQAHFARDFRNAVGKSPSDFMRSRQADEKWSS